MNQKAKKKYVTPTVAVIHVVVEKGVAAHFPIQSLSMIDWEYELPEDDPNSNSDIWLDL